MSGLSHKEMSLLQGIFKQIKSVNKAVLFGSRAMGLNRHNSDIDIALYGDNLALSDILKINAKVEETTMPYMFDFLLANTINENLAEHIRTYGKVIYSQSEHERNHEQLGLKCKLSDVCAIKYGKDHKRLANGKIPVYGSGGIMRYVETALYDKKSVLIPRKGSLDNLYFVKEPFWTVDTLFYTEINEEKVIPEYLFYFLKMLDLAGMNVGTAVPSLTASVLNEVELYIPNLLVQRNISNTLSALDNKIANNTKINHHLEQMAQAIFKSWFVDFEPFGGEMPDDWKEAELGDIVLLSAGGDKPSVYSPIQTDECPIPIYSNGIDNFGLYGFTDKAKITLESVTVSARGTIGYVCIRQDPFVPIVRLVTAIPNTEYITAKYLYLYLRSIHIAGVGTTQQQLTVPDFKKYRILVPNKNIIDNFTKVVNPMFSTIRHNLKGNAQLVAMRDALLPRLMSGEITVIQN